MNSTPTCWCGQAELADFSPDYWVCKNCRTLVLKHWPPKEQFSVRDDHKDLYGESYYKSHLPANYGYPALTERARGDFHDRCMHWLRKVLKYRLPPARALELGCAHGAFVALLRWAGFDATGLELSPWLVNFAKSNFGIPMLTGRIEEQKIEPQSLDMILLFDVLEHLPEPLSTMRLCMKLLKSDGLLIVQTPCFPSERTYAEMVETKDRFLEQLKPMEHLYLFSRDSIRQFFSLAGAPFVYFEPAAFDYDMFLVASPSQHVGHSPEKAMEALFRQPQGRMVQALLDANAQYMDLVPRLRRVEVDCQARLELLKKADARIKEIEADRQARQQLLVAADARIREIEADRQVRLRLLMEADARIKEIEADREARKQDLLKIEASYQKQMSSLVARLLRRLQAILRIDAVYKTVEETAARRSKTSGSRTP
jgi:2-polyprenyl-3-methyl-5-hydroxy-6-metoxy-1,4-benzoquinol methylase